MTASLRFSANINTFNACADRYVLSDYGERLTTGQLIQAATQVPGLTGVEVVGLWHVAVALQTGVRNTERLLDMAGKLLESDLSLAHVKADAVLATQIVWETVLK